MKAGAVNAPNYSKLPQEYHKSGPYDFIQLYSK